MARYTLGFVAAWIVVGIIVASFDDYFHAANTTARVLTAVAAVLLWPILLFGFDIRVR